MATPNEDLPKSAEEKRDRVHLDDHAVGVILAACRSEGGKKRKRGNGLPGFLSSDFTLQRQKTLTGREDETVSEMHREVMEVIERMEAIERSGGTSPSFAKLKCIGRKLLKEPTMAKNVCR